MSLLRQSREKRMRRRAYSNADVTLLANRFGCLLTASEPPSANPPLVRRPMFVSGSLTECAVDLPRQQSSARSINEDNMNECCSEKSSDDEKDVADREPAFEESSDSQNSSGKPIRSPLARSSATVRTPSGTGERLEQVIGTLVRSSGSSNESESSAASQRLTFSIDQTDDDSADDEGLRKSVSESVLPSQRASIDEDALADTIAAVNLRLSKPRPRLFRRKSKLERVLEENDPNFTLIHYCSDLLCRVPPRVFRVPNMAIAPYMRTCLMRAHASSCDADPFRVCSCTGPACEHLTPDATAKFAAVYVLDANAGRDACIRYRGPLTEHMRRSTLGAGAWAEYEIAPHRTEFNGAVRVTFVYLICGFF